MPPVTLALEELEQEVASGALDTVVVAFTDMQGRLVGKRLAGEHFLEVLAGGGTVEACNYLLAVDMEMDPVPGYEIASWEQGYGDLEMRPDLATLRRLPWLEGTALVLCDLAWPGGDPVAPSPRQVLRRQVERARGLGWEPMVGSELEFYLLRETYEAARAAGFAGLTPSVPYSLDYHVLATSYDEPFLRRVRNRMREADVPVESSKGEAHAGQHEINIRFADALTTADRHAVYKNGIKEMAHQQGVSVTFMAKPDRRWLGSSCHLHTSLWSGGVNAFAGDQVVFDQALAGQIAVAGDLALLLAPTVNSYKRYAAGTWAPTSLAWGHDNRTCGFRVVGPGAGRRIECRIPGADANPYLAIAGLIAGAVHGIERGLEPPPAQEGNAYTSSGTRFPATLAEAIRRWESSELPAEVLGEDVARHYLNYARHEQEAFDAVVTDYERRRWFERG
jgi:glutamine synthetase